jgi:hypothetical protein
MNVCAVKLVPKISVISTFQAGAQDANLNLLVFCSSIAWEIADPFTGR